MGSALMWSISVILPLDEGASQPMSVKPSSLAKSCTLLPKVIKFLKDNDPVGRMGKYSGVYNLALHSGGYTPDRNATPSRGLVGSDETDINILFTTWADKTVKRDQILEFCEGLAKLHIDEHPIIEVKDVLHWMPNET